MSEWIKKEETKALFEEILSLYLTAEIRRIENESDNSPVQRELLRGEVEQYRRWFEDIEMTELE